jgi:acyl carrier protein
MDNEILDAGAAEAGGMDAGTGAEGSQSAVPSREKVIAMLAAFGDRSHEEVAERIGSIELTWLITKVEQQYDVTLDLSDEALDRMTTVSGAVAALRDELAAAGAVHD